MSHAQTCKALVFMLKATAKIQAQQANALPLQCIKQFIDSSTPDLELAVNFAWIARTRDKTKIRLAWWIHHSVSDLERAMVVVLVSNGAEGKPGMPPRNKLEREVLSLLT
eukprot:TRINITY_DN35708_c0_g1_i1.p1 TRINITY_DN35708_c0_g1~~TRINITY_DN35708_c0_g1_i1.p1  ORF type:complete len:110 (-),score=17.31 TRINITY_DN35708_c0_g1_i1:40-369(-)